MGTRARRRETDSAGRVRALTRRAYLATAGHLDLDDDPPAPSAAPSGGFEEILRGPDEPPRAAGRTPVRWKVSGRAVIAAVLVLAALTGIVVVRSVATGSRAAVPLPHPAAEAVDEVPRQAPEGTGTDPPAAQDTATTDEPDATDPAEPAGDQHVQAETIVVHVAGAVQAPGIVTVALGARVADVVDLAGGPTPAAELGAINLARTVADGEQVYVPEVGQADPGAQAGPPPGTPPDGPTGAAPAGEPSPVDLNSADQAALETLPGVGPAIAQRILDWRAANGSFHSVDELQEVPGIGPTTMERLRPRVTV